MDRSISARRKAQNLARNGDLAGAVREIEVVAQAGEGDPYDFIFRGDLLSRMRRFDEAVLAYEEAVSAYERAGLYRNAIAVCKKILRTDSARKRTHGRLGDLYAKEGLASEAVSHFLAFLDSAGDDATGEEFLETLERVAELAGHRPEATLRIADLFVRIGREDRASQLLLDIAEQTESKGAMEIAQEMRARARAILPPPPTSIPAPATTEASIEIVAFPQLEPSPIDVVARPPASARADVDVAETAAFGGSPSGNGGSKPVERAIHGRMSDAEVAPWHGETEAEPDAEVEPEVAPEFEAGVEPEAEAGADAGVEIGDGLQWETAGIPADSRESAASQVETTPQDGPRAENLHEGLWSAIARKDWVLARNIAATLHEADPEDSVALENLVVVSRELGDTLATVQYLILLGDLKINKEELEESLHCFLKVMELDPENVTARRRLTRFREMNVPGSERITEECRNSILGILSTDGATVSVKSGGGLESEEWFDVTALLQEFREMTNAKLDANDVEGHYDLGLSHHEMGLFEEAIEEFGIVLGSGTLTPEMEVKAREMRAECLARIERHREAIHDYRAALDIGGLSERNQTPLRYQLACALEKVGESEEARAIFQSLSVEAGPYLDSQARLDGLGG